MKHISLLSFLVALTLSAQAQEVVIDTNYYAPPPVVRRRVLMADPDQNTNSSSLRANRRADKRREILDQLDEVQTWYIGIEGGLRSNGSLLSNSIDRLVSSPTQTKVNWGGYVGYTYRNAWALETGYMQSPIQLNITIANGSTPLVFNYQNSGAGLPLRLKRRIGSGKRTANGTGFWLTGGAWLVPNGSGQRGEFNLIGYTYRGRNRSDTIRLTNSTSVSNRITGLAELGVEYAARLSPQLELGFYCRKYWGLGNALQSDLVYTVNKTALQNATITADGTGWGLRVSLRYIYGRQYEMKKSTHLTR